MTDQQIIALYLNRNETAIAETAEKYGTYCHTIAQRIVHNALDSEECVNDTWLQAWNAIPPHQPVRLHLFLAKITRNLAFNRYRAAQSARRGGGELPLVLEELTECIGTEDTEGQVMAGALIRALEDFLRRLSKRERSIFLRRYFLAQTTSEIASAWGLKESNVHVILSRTRQRLKRHLELEELL